jgi:hypothetical protein
VLYKTNFLTTPTNSITANIEKNKSMRYGHGSALVPYLKNIWYYAAQLRTTIIQNLEKNNFHKRVKCSRSFNFGKKQDLSPDILQDYQYAGAIHILSVRDYMLDSCCCF